MTAPHHVTILGHVTPVGLRSKLTDTDAANGFANRLLFLAVRRSPPDPVPEGAPDELVRDLVEPLHRAIMEARSIGEMAFDGDARDRWEAFYAELAMTPRLGLAGAMTGRHEAQVARLALVYALADRSPAIGAVHLDAAIALADYARRSATWALGDSTGNRHADVPASDAGRRRGGLEGRENSPSACGRPPTWPMPSRCWSTQDSRSWSRCRKSLPPAAAPPAPGHPSKGCKGCKGR